MLVAIVVIGILIYIGSPWYIQLIFLALNSIIPDPIPFLDEIVMYSTFIIKILRGFYVFDWVSEHPVLTTIIIIAIIVAIIILFF